MVLRQGKFGDFYACSNYPTCKFTKQKVTELDVSCPKCGSKHLRVTHWKTMGFTTRFAINCYDCDYTGPIIEGNQELADEIHENYLESKNHSE